MERPETQYAWSGDVALAYQVVGEGPIDLLYLPGIVSNVDVMWESPSYERFLHRLASFARLILMDRRGYGCSERFSPDEVAPLEVLMDDVLVVLDAVGSERTAVFSFEEANLVAILLSAARPDRMSHAILLDPSPSWMRNDELPWEWDEERWEVQIDMFRRHWGTLEGARSGVGDLTGTIVGKDLELRWWAKFARATQGPGATVAETRKFSQTDVRRVLPTVHVPTLVLHRPANSLYDARSPRYVADHIESARYVEVPGHQTWPWYEGWEALSDEIEDFVIGTRRGPEPNRLLTTVLFTDIVSSTELAARAGDSDWHQLIDTHHAAVRAELVRFSGVEQDTAGDGFYATFDGPARAVRCAQAIVREIRTLGLEVRAGVHTGECEVIDGKAGGIATAIGARVMSLGGPSEVVVSQTVKDLVAGSGLAFEDRGEHELKGIPGSWRIHRVLD